MIRYASKNELPSEAALAILCPQQRYGFRWFDCPGTNAASGSSIDKTMRRLMTIARARAIIRKSNSLHLFPHLLGDLVGHAPLDQLEGLGGDHGGVVEQFQARLDRNAPLLHGVQIAERVDSGSGRQ